VKERGPVHGSGGEELEDHRGLRPHHGGADGLVVPDTGPRM